MTTLNKSIQFQPNTVLTLPKLPEGTFNISFVRDTKPGATFESHNQTIQGIPYPLAVTPTVEASLVRANILTNGDDVKTCVELCFELTDLSMNFQPGDCLGIVPKNLSSEVNKLLNHLSLVEDADVPYVLVVTEGKFKKYTSSLAHVPTSSTIRYVLQNCLEIRAVPKKLLLRVLAEHTTEPREKRRLEELCSREGSKEFSQLITESRVSLFDIFEAFPSCSPPIEWLFEFLPRLQARPYSIASSPLNTAEVSIVFSLFEFPPKSTSKEKKYGVCTGWLYNTIFGGNKTLIEKMGSLNLINDNSHKPKVPLFLRKNTGFSFPDDQSVPLILIGPGTGIAPFIGFLQHRDHLKSIATKEQIFGEIWLFFGCRFSDKDFIFKAAIDDFLERGVLSRLFVSFSRDVPSSLAEVRYVQDNIKNHGKEFVSQLIEKRSHVYICGDAKNMAKDVFEAIVLVIMEETGASTEEAHELVSRLKRDGRYIQDIWT